MKEVNNLTLCYKVYYLIYDYVKNDYSLSLKFPSKAKIKPEQTLNDPH